MIRVTYLQWGKRVEHPETFETVDEAVAFLYHGGVPCHPLAIADFAYESIIDGDRVIRGSQLDRLVNDYETAGWA